MSRLDWILLATTGFEVVFLWRVLNEWAVRLIVVSLLLAAGASGYVWLHYFPEQQAASTADVRERTPWLYR